MHLPGLPLILLLMLLVSCSSQGSRQEPGTSAGRTKEDNMQYNPLTKEEERVIIHKGTEPPFTGKYVQFHEDGAFHCKQCGEPLFSSENKFDSGTGWPSFDDAIEGAVREIPDADGRRTEIVCANCGAHLGHVFRNEGFTDKNTRHCVNSISLQFSPDNPQGAADHHRLETAVFAGGCFWGVEHHFKKVKGVISTTAGYTGGHKANPTYKEVCYTDTGHAEAVQVEFDPAQVSYETLARLFFEIHDPTQLDRQGPDRGTQYRSAVYYANEAQKKTAEELIEQLKNNGYNVVTRLEEASTFYPAEGYHQDYYEKTGHEPYCHIYQKRFTD